MFNNQKKEYEIFTSKETKNSYNEQVQEWVKSGTAEVFISLNTRANYEGNGFNILQCEYTGISNYPNFQKGMRIGQNYLVEYVVPHRNEYFLFLKEIESNGRCE